MWYKISISSLIPHSPSSAWPSLLVSLSLSWVFKLGYWVFHFHLHFSLSFHQYSLYWIGFYNSRLSLVFHSVYTFVFLGIPQVFILFKLNFWVYWVILLCLFKVLELFHEILFFPLIFLCPGIDIDYFHWRIFLQNGRLWGRYTFLSFHFVFFNVIWACGLILLLVCLIWVSWLPWDRTAFMIYQ